MELVLATYPSWSLLVVRVGLGVVFFAHGAQKVLGWFDGRRWATRRLYRTPRSAR
jgi:putative oxidoreductase